MRIKQRVRGDGPSADRLARARMGACASTSPSWQHPLLRSVLAFAQRLSSSCRFARVPLSSRGRQRLDDQLRELPERTSGSGRRDGGAVIIRGPAEVPVTCQYCGHPAELLRASHPGYPYPADWGPAWKCTPCDAYIRCYAGTTRPLGELADAETRHWRSRAHHALDGLWCGGAMSRSAAYRWLANALQLPEHEAHIGLMDADRCRRVIELVAARKRQA